MITHLASKLVLLAWNCIAYATAVLLLAAGSARRGRKRAFRRGAISAIYFHKPPRTLVLRCVRWLVKHGYTFVSADDVVDMCMGRKPVPRGAVWLSFDDGWREWIEEILPLVRRFHIPVTLFIPSGLVEGDGRFPHRRGSDHLGDFQEAARGNAAQRHQRDTITLAELKAIALCPEVTIGSHTVTHTLTPDCTDEQIRVEVGECKLKLESWIGRPVRCFAYPEGKYDGRERAFLAESGYEIAVTTRSDFITADLDRYGLPRFSVGDYMSFPQAICSMVGVWRPLVDPVKAVFERVIDRIQRRRARPHPPVPSGACDTNPALRYPAAR